MQTIPVEEQEEEDSSASCEIDKFLKRYLNGEKPLNKPKREQLIDKVLAMCEPEDLVYLSKRLDDFKRDFFALLPLEIIERVLNFLDWKSVLNCCQVNSVWNKKLSKSFNKFWFDLCCRELPLNEREPESSRYDAQVDYKSAFVRIMRSGWELENGRMFRSWQVGPIDINAVATYDNVLATATHRVKFWRLEPLPPASDSLRKHRRLNGGCCNGGCNVDNDNEAAWICFKSFFLQSRASALKFDSCYLLASTYFLTVDLYSLESQSLLCQYIGHTCSITAFDFINSAASSLVCTGSADNSIKFWTISPMQTPPSPPPVPGEKFISSSLPSSTLPDEPLTCLAFKTEPNIIWPVKITIEPFNRKKSSAPTGDDEYLVMALCANGFLFLNLLLPGGEISDTYKSLLNLQPPSETLIEFQQGYFLDNDPTAATPIISNRSWVDLRGDEGLLTAFVVTENNSMQSKKVFSQQWRFRKNFTYLLFEFSSVQNLSQTDDDSSAARETTEATSSTTAEDSEDFYSFLNKRMLKNPNIGQFEVVSFGFNYCLLLDESNVFHLCHLKKQTITCIQSALSFDNETTTAFRVHSSNSSQEQFVFSDHKWLNGFELINQNETPTNDDRSDFVCAFYTHKRNELFIIGWNNSSIT